MGSAGLIEKSNQSNDCLRQYALECKKTFGEHSDSQRPPYRWRFKLRVPEPYAFP